MTTACSDSGVNDDTNGGQTGGDTSDGQQPEPKPDPVKKEVYLEELDYTYQSVGYGQLCINKDSSGNTLSLYKDETETEHEHGFFAHAYSTISYDDIETMGFTSFSAYIGINKTARVANTQTSVIFRVLVDNEEVYTSEQFGAYTDEEFITIDIEGASRLTLIADSVGGNGHDHAVWADCTLTYYDDIKPNLKAFDVEFSSPYQVTEENILENAKATAFDGTDLSDKITYTTNYIKGQAGDFTITYKVSDGVATAEKTVEMSVLSKERYITDASEEYLLQPFADYVYYGRSLLSSQSRLAYDAIMEALLAVNISNSEQKTLTVNLMEKGIYIYPSEVARIKTYLVYDEARLYFLYDWRVGESAGTSYTKSGAFVETATFTLYNGSGQYYYGQNNHDVYLQAEKEVSTFFSKLTYDMSEPQMIYRVKTDYFNSMTYANVNYADGFYGAFITKQCICSGYSKGYSYLMQRLGIRSAYAVGTAGGAHAWNYLYAAGDWYMSDSTWGNGNFYTLEGKEYMNSSGRYDYSNYSKMPTLAEKAYDADLMKYPLMSIKSGYMIAAGDKLDLNELVTVTDTVVDKTTVTSVTYTGTLNTNKSGTYTITVTAVNNLGNIANGECEVYVYEQTKKLTDYEATQSGNSNFAKRAVSLYYGGNECEFTDGIYTKANGTLSLDFDISGGGYTRFSANVGVDKVIRDNVSWGGQVNATVRVYADGVKLYELSGIGWKKDYTYFTVSLPEGTNTLRLEVTDNSGQGGVGWGDCLLYK